MSESEPFNLLRAKLDEAKAQMEAQLNRERFRAEPGAPPCEYWYRPPSRWRRAYWRVRGYFHTLWLALKGIDLEVRCDDDY